MAAAASAFVAVTTIAWAGLGGLPRWLTALSHRPPASVEADNDIASVEARHQKTRTTARALAVAGPALQPEPAPIRVPPSEPARPSHGQVAAVQGRDGDSQLVVHAMWALRRGRDPALARALSGLYLQRHASGALAEEALALTVEAALVHGDPDASALGARYLRRYPNGPFSGLARQANRAPAPSLPIRR